MSLFRCGGGGQGVDRTGVLYLLDEALGKVPDLGISYDDFVDNSVRYGNFNSLSNNAGSVQYKCNAASNSWYSFWLNDPIDLTNYTKAIIVCSYSGYTSLGGSSSFGFSRTIPNSTQPTFDIPVGPANSNHSGKYEIDVTNYTGDYYFGCRGAGSGSGYQGVSNISSIMFT